jgi:hypothetical protein
MKTKTLLLFAALLTAFANAQIAKATPVTYNVSVMFLDDTTFTGTFKYDAATKTITNLKGLLDDVLMGDTVWLSKKLTVVKDAKGGISATIYALNTKAIRTDPPINNNAYATINFNALNPTLGAIDKAKLAYMDCTPGALMGDTCMYDLSKHNPVIPMAGGHGNLWIKITKMGTSKESKEKDNVSRSDCLFNWVEKTYPQFSPAGTATQTQPLYYYRHYPNSNVSLGISSSDNHLYYKGTEGSLQDWGDLSIWLTSAGC